MAATVKFRAMTSELQVAVNKALSPAERQKAIATAARKIISDIDRQNAQVAGGQSLPHDEFVDGRKSAPLETVNPDHGVIVAKWQFVNEVVDWIWETLVAESPYGDRDDIHYRDWHMIFADGEQLEKPDPNLQAKEWVIASGVPYARKLEHIYAVYESVAAMAKSRFGNTAYIRYVFWVIRDGDNPFSAWANPKTEARRADMRAYLASADLTEKKRRQLVRRTHRLNEKDLRQPAIVITPR